ncbi:uncharacterized protein IL334_005519 [Kwoniella shivajii]|uniref:Uncharacterized protein n=1 Tax=Kwoniella shivajii TaxID=564305 RepID=A0ABZ1D3E2_9TREE|nr:hypothetical protein IL334_005519 [Kwoniella shivajii]
MSLPTASSSLRSLRTLSLSASRGYASLTPYSPLTSNDHIPNRRPARPTSPQFFTGRPTFHESLSDLSSTITNTKQSLRKSNVYPLPSALPHINPPQASWVSKEELSSLFQVKLRTNTLRQVMELLTELHHLRHISNLAGYPDLVNKIDQTLDKYERNHSSSTSVSTSTSNFNEDEKFQLNQDKSGIDQFGRAYSSGRKKTSSSRIWLIPSNSLLISSSSSSSSTSTTSTTSPTTTSTEVKGNEKIKSDLLINHIPLSQYFPRPSDRETILRPLKITGYLGGFNVFGFARGGGLSGQAGAVALGIARALSILKEDARDVLQADGALMRDTRMTERKKTGRAKARKGYTWVKR